MREKGCKRGGLAECLSISHKYHRKGGQKTGKSIFVHDSEGKEGGIVSGKKGGGSRFLKVSGKSPIHCEGTKGKKNQEKSHDKE